MRSFTLCRLSGTLVPAETVLDAVSALMCWMLCQPWCVFALCFQPLCFSHFNCKMQPSISNRISVNSCHIQRVGIHGWDYRRWLKRWSSRTSWVSVTEAIIRVFVTTACCYCHLEFSLFSSVSFSIREEMLLHRKCLYVHVVCVHRHAHLCILLKVNV